LEGTQGERGAAENKNCVCIFSCTSLIYAFLTAIAIMKRRLFVSVNAQPNGKNLKTKRDENFSK
jgi:hypothetical protein